MLRVFAACLGVLLLASLGCSSVADDPRAHARIVANRTELVGGPRALGDVGDYLLENDQVRIVIQRPGWSRGFGVYGGSLIDADLRRPSEEGTSGAGSGFDNFGELFPAFFVQAVDATSVRIVDDGARGGAARIDVTGEAGDFLELLALLNRSVTGSNADLQVRGSTPRLRYTTSYRLAPRQRYVTIRFSIENISGQPVTFPAAEARSLLGPLGLPLDGFTVPVGDIALFGATSPVFIPGIGFDLRFGLEEAYDKNTPFPAFPGIVAEFVASRGARTSYGIAMAETEANYVLNKRRLYDDGKAPMSETSMLIPFVASSFVGMFYADAPPFLAPGESFDVEKYFIVGSGDVGSVLDTVYQVHGTASGHLGGRVLDRVTGAPATDASVLVYQRRGNDRRIFSQYDVREHGSFGGHLEPGSYSARVGADDRPWSDFVDFEIAENRSTGLLLESTPPARVVVRVTNTTGDGIPAKVTAVGSFAPEHAGKLTRDFLFDLRAGDEFRASDMVTDDPNDADTRQYIEAVGFTHDGVAELSLRPGSYEIYTSHGPEYDVQVSRVVAESLGTSTVSHTLHHVVDTRGWVAGDTHIHSRNSVDSAMTLDQRVQSLAAEGVEWAVSTDHNFITDYRPFVARNRLERWIHPMVGVELTTLESGHFNGYPLRYDVGAITQGAPAWQQKPPDALFDSLRALGSLGRDRTFVQVNHPRDNILGYYSQYQRDAFTMGEVQPNSLARLLAPTGPAFRNRDNTSTFSLRYDAVELANGKLMWEVHHYRVPAKLPSGELPTPVPPAGTIVLKDDGQPGFPGVVDDWMNQLNLGMRLVGMGSGDSHDAGDEAGHFRTMVYVGDDDPMALTDERILDALRRGRVVVTNGPLVDMYVDDPKAGAMGNTLTRVGAAKVALHYTVTAAPWLSVERINVYRNGVIVATKSIDPERDLARDPLVESLDVPLATNAAGLPIDSWFVVEAMGYRSMFPIIRPVEVRPVMLTDAVASLAGPLGLANDQFGALRPPEVFPITPYAITNPVWVKTTEGDFRPPGIVPIDVRQRPENDPHFQEGVEGTPTASRKVRRVRASSQATESAEGSKQVPLFYPRRGNVTDVRGALSRMGHMAGHGP